MQKQPSGGVLRKRCSENMQQIYRRIPMSKCDFNKVALLCKLVSVLAGAFHAIMVKIEADILQTAKK